LLALWLHDTADPVSTLRGYLYDDQNRSESNKKEAVLVPVAGRTLPIVEFSTRQQQTVASNFKMLFNSGDYAALKDLFSRNTIVCYRDRWGRKAFGAILDLSIDDELGDQRTTLTVNAVDYSEAV
jgi:hypothetical protein